MRNISILIIAIVFLFGCNNSNNDGVVQKTRIFPQYNEALDVIIKTNNGVIRGINLNSKSDSILKVENTNPTETETDRLYFEFVIDTITNYSVEYSLLNDSLEEISLQINCKDLDVSSKIYNDLRDYYEKKLPNPIEDQGQVVYNCFEGQKKPFVVSLSDNSTPTTGIVNLVIYKDK